MDYFYSCGQKYIYNKVKPLTYIMQVSKESKYVPSPNKNVYFKRHKSYAK